MAQLALVDAPVLAEEVGGGGVLEERITDGFQPFQVDGIIGVGHGE